MSAEIGDALIRRDRESDGIAILTLSRPQKRNAINVAMRRQLREEIDRIVGDGRTRVLLLAADGPVFSAGTDLREAATIAIAERSEAWQSLWTSLDRLTIPVIAAVDGPALGAGFELALACDLIVASRRASFALPEVRHGFVPGGGGSQRLVRQIGKYRAMHVILSAETLSAEDVSALGLITCLVEMGRSRDAALELARKIAAMPSQAVCEAKALLKAGPDLPLPQALALEQSALERLDGGRDQRERLAVFSQEETAD